MRCVTMEEHTLKNVNNCINTNYSYLEKSGGQSSSLYLNVVHFSGLIRNPWQFKTAVFMHWFIIFVVPLSLLLCVSQISLLC
jgi:hypothetical protein